MSADRSLTDDLGFLLSRASGAVARPASKTLAPLGLRVRSYSVLALASEHGAGVTQRRLAATMGLDPSQILALVDELEKAGLVERAADPADRRNKLIVPTDNGIRVHEQARARVDEANRSCFDGLPQERVDELRETLRHIAFSDDPGASTDHGG